MHMENKTNCTNRNAEHINEEIVEKNHLISSSQTKTAITGKDPNSIFNSNHIALPLLQKSSSLDCTHQKSTGKNMNNNILSDSSCYTLANLEQVCKNLRSAEKRAGNENFSTAQKIELDKLLESAQSLLKSIRHLVNERAPSTSHVAESIHHSNVDIAEVSEKSTVSNDSFTSHKEIRLPRIHSQDTTTIDRNKIKGNNEITKSVTTNKEQTKKKLENSTYFKSDKSDVDEVYSKSPPDSVEGEIISKVIESDCIENKISNEKKLEAIEKRRNEIKSEVDTFIGITSDPKFYELKEYTVRLLLEMDDLVFPKGSELHFRKRELLKEVYKYTDILEKKTEDFESVKIIEDDITHIIRNFYKWKDSTDDLKQIKNNLKYFKSKLDKLDIKGALEERKQACIEQMNEIEKIVTKESFKNCAIAIASETENTDSANILDKVEKQNDPLNAATFQTNHSICMHDSQLLNKEKNLGALKSEEHDLNEKKLKEVERHTNKYSLGNQQLPTKNERASIEEISTFGVKKITGEQFQQLPTKNEPAIVEETSTFAVKQIAGEQLRGTYSVGNSERIILQENHLMTVLNHIDADIFRANEQINFINMYGSGYEYSWMKNYLLTLLNTLEEISNGSSSYTKISELRDKILNMLIHLEQEIEALINISHIENKFYECFEKVRNLGKQDIFEMKNTIIHLRESLPNIPLCNIHCCQRIHRCYVNICLCLEDIDTKIGITRATAV